MLKKMIFMLAVALCVPAYAQNAGNSKRTSPEYKEKKCITKTYELEHADFDEIEKELNTIIGHCNIANKATNSENNEHFLINKARRIVTIHATPENFEVIDEHFKAINKPLPQVLIEASIIAIDDGLEKQLGIKWNGLNGTTGYFGPQKTKEEEPATGLAALFGGNDNNNNANDGHNGEGKTSKSLRDHFKYGGIWDFSSVSALLSAVESDGKSQVLSRPRILSLTGETSSIHVGEEIPYTSGKTVTDGGNVTSNVEFKEVGIKLGVTPIVNRNDNSINMKVTPEVSQFVGTVVMGDNKVPQISTRKSESTIKINNGETIVLGGLIETKLLKSIYKIPVLGNLPLIGKAFRNKTNANTKTNLVILLTAHILSDKGKDNTLSSKAVKEINRIKSLKDSKAMEEISQPLINKPYIYGKDIEIDGEDDEIFKSEINFNNNKQVIEHLENKLEEIRKK